MRLPLPASQSPRRRPSPSRAASLALPDYLRAFLFGALGAATLAAAIVGGYAVKSRLGINLMSGPSPLHGVFVAMRSAGLV